MLKSRLSIVALLSVLIPSTVSAATLVEGVDYADAPIADLGAFGAGVHTVSGTLNGSCLGAVAPFDCTVGGDPKDAIAFSLLPGQQLVDFGLSFATVQQGQSVFRSQFTYTSPEENFTFSNLQDGAYDIAFLTPTSGPVTISFGGDNSDSPADWSGDWTLELTVTGVPLPGALGLFASGLFGIGWLGRRRTQA